MYFKVEPSGCCERKGLVQVRYCLYLDPEDYGYEKHHVQMPVIPKDGYPGKIKDGIPVDMDDYEKWLDGLPKEWQDNPFHNHFCYFDSRVTNDEVAFVGKLALQTAKEEWERDRTPNVTNMPVQFNKSPREKTYCEAKARSIITANLAGRLD